jgi:hypothetical protein
MVATRNRQLTRKLQHVAVLSIHFKNTIKSNDAACAPSNYKQTYVSVWRPTGTTALGGERRRGEEIRGDIGNGTCSCGLSVCRVSSGFVTHWKCFAQVSDSLLPVHLWICVCCLPSPPVHKRRHICFLHTVLLRNAVRSFWCRTRGSRRVRQVGSPVRAKFNRESLDPQGRGADYRRTYHSG